jgi:hypothetical protein
MTKKENEEQYFPRFSTFNKKGEVCSTFRFSTVLRFHFNAQTAYMPRDVAAALPAPAPALLRAQMAD